MLVCLAVFKTVCRGLGASRVGSIPTYSRQKTQNAEAQAPALFILVLKMSRMLILYRPLVLIRVTASPALHTAPYVVYCNRFKVIREGMIRRDRLCTN